MALVSDIAEATALCTTLQSCLDHSLELAEGDSSRVVLVLDLDETCFTPLNPDALGTSTWFEDIVARWAPVLEKEEGMDYVATLFAVLAVVDVFYSQAPHPHPHPRPRPHHHLTVAVTVTLTLILVAGSSGVHRGGASRAAAQVERCRYVSLDACEEV